MKRLSRSEQHTLHPANPLWLAAVAAWRLGLRPPVQEKLEMEAK